MFYTLFMSTLAFILIATSALMHALYNLLIKKSICKTVFIWWMFVSSTALFTLALPLLPGRFPCPDMTLLILCGGGAFCFVLYHLFLGRAYQSGDLSITYPLSQTALFYVPFWGYWLFNEQLSLAGVMGIICVGGGAYLVQIRQFTFAGLVRPFGSLVEPSVQAALAAGFVYSLGAIIDKIGVTSYHPIYFTYFLILFMLLFMTMNLLRPCYRSRIIPELVANRRFILASGPVMMGSFLTFRYGLSLTPMSYAVTVRQVSVLVGVIIGVLFLKEACGRIRFTAALMILVGVALIRLS